jgi:hypothetical protein
LDKLIEIGYLLLPWLILVISVLVFFKLFGWARKKKTSAVVFGVLVQMFMPDPYVERTIKVVQEDKKQKISESEDQDSVFDLLDESEIKKFSKDKM